MTVQEFLDMKLDGEVLVSIYDCDTDYDYVNDSPDVCYGGYVFEGWSDEIENYTDSAITTKWLESEIESWNYYKSEKYGETMICLNISSES